MTLLPPGVNTRKHDAERHQNNALTLGDSVS